MLWLLVASALGGEGSLASAKQTERTLALATSALARAQRSPSPDRFEEIPPWVDLAAPHGSGGDPGALARALSSKDPTIRALAARWIAVDPDPSDLRLLEPLIDDDSPAGFFPERHVTQQVMPSYPVEWIEQTVSAAALRSLSQIAGLSFPDTSAYMRWRQAHPDPARAPDLWAHVLSADPDRESRLAALEPEIALRTRWMLDPTDDELLSQWREGFDPDRTVGVLLGRERLVEHSDPDVFLRFCRFAVQTLPAEHLSALRADEAYPREARGALALALALALARSDPERAQQLLVEAIEDPSSGPPAELLAEIVKRYSDSQRALLVRFLSMPDGTTTADQGRIAILSAIASRQRAAKPLLIALLSEARFQSEDPEVVEALAAAAQSTGLVGEPCSGPFHPAYLKGPPPDLDTLIDLRNRREQCVTAALAAAR